jgi:phosphatidylserine decarboxylase
MEIFVLCALLSSLVFTQWFFRKFWFHRQNLERDEIDRLPFDIVCSPVDGVVVYKKRVDKGQAFSVKLNKQVGEAWTGGKSGWLIGIYMSIFDRHFVIAPVSGSNTSLYFKTDKNLPMMDLLEYIKFYGMSMTSRRMAEHAEEYVDSNERLKLDWDSGVKMLVIGDANVNKIIPEPGLGDGDTLWTRGDKLLFIRRGSQCDIFIPDDFGSPLISVIVGKKLSAGSPIAVWRRG